MPGKPTVYQTTTEFLKTFGMSNLDELPELPRYKIDENEQIVIDDIIEEMMENIDYIRLSSYISIMKDLEKK